MLGASLFKLGREDEGIAHARDALESDPELYEVAAFLANFEFRERNLDRALALARQALAVRPDLGDAHLVVGKVLSLPGHLDISRSIVHLKRALEDEGVDSPEAHILLA